MTRLTLGRTALVGTLVWAVAYAAPGQEAKPKPADPAKPAAAAPAKPDADPAPRAAGATPQAQKINELIRKGYETAGIKKPAAKATDTEFLRRVFIDLIGRIATPEEVIDFERDTAPDKRVKLVQRLLHAESYVPKTKEGRPATIPGAGKGETKPLKFFYAEEYASHWAEIWTVWLMTRTGHQDYRDQMNVWLTQQFVNNVSHKDLVTKLLTAKGQVGGPRADGGYPYKDSYAGNFIVHHLGEAVRDPKERNLYGAFDAVPITSRTTKLFLGLQTQCTQCHDHPFNKEWSQKDFWGVNAFFRQTVRSATPTGNPVGNNAKMANAALITLTDDPTLNPELIVLYERRDGRREGSFPIMLKDYAQAIAGEKSSKMISAATSRKSRREQLAEWVVTHDNFSKAYVNRVWAHLFGRGLNKEPGADDFGSNNEVVHPELLDYLGEQFASPSGNFDPKRLLEWVCTSDVYGLSHVANKDYTDQKYDPYFARMPLKAMSPEVLFESLTTATKADRKKELQKDRRDAWMRKLVRQFGDDEGNELSFNGTIVQALLMMNGQELNGEIGAGRNGGGNDLIQEVVKKSGGRPGEVYNELFLMTLNRRPTQAETTKLEQVRQGAAKVAIGSAPPPPAKGPAPKGPAPKGPAPKSVEVFAPGAGGTQDVGFYQDVFWALLNTSEFMLNH